MNQPTISKSKFEEIIARIREREAAKRLLDPTPTPDSEDKELTVTFIPAVPEADISDGTDRFGKSITYNERQTEAIRIAGIEGKSCVIVGAAGTGKTTVMKAVVQKLIQSSRARILPPAHGHKYLPITGGVPGILVCAYTRRATNNIRKNMTEEMKGNCITIHKSLEYAPVFYEVEDPETGKIKKKMEFLPSRDSLNPFPEEIFAIVYEESSMDSVPLYEEMRAAYPSAGVQEIFLGDIQQLPPIFGPAILGYKMLELPVVELTEVYRQALDSPIISLAHRILSGKVIPANELDFWSEEGKLKIAPWKKSISAESALEVSFKLFNKFYDSGDYNPENDMILMPFNKSYGTLDMNRSIANHISRAHQRVTHEVIAGFNKHYFSVGDKVLLEREDAVILKIETNPTYTGARFTPASAYLDYWGHDSTPQHLKSVAQQAADGEDDVDFILAQVSSGSDEERVTQASHTITLKMMDSDLEREISTASEINATILGYALTVHKAQGSEWDKVFLLFHSSHNTMMQRELLYTAVTRAKESLFIVCEQDTFIKGIERQRIVGNTIEEKAEFFKGKKLRDESEV